jgi:purine-binding chemotaxis protein CheW
MDDIPEKKNADLAGKYLTFKLVDEEYGLEILKVREIIGMMAITSLPRMPSFVRGVINLRGRVIPVIDLRRKFEMEETTDTSATCIIVVDVRATVGIVRIGILVDSVSEVLDIVGEDIEKPPTCGANANTAFILGMAKAKGGVKILLNIEKVLSSEELDSVANVA